VRYKRITAIFFLLAFSQAIAKDPSIQAAAARYVPGVHWRAKSVVTGDFSCQGRVQQAILGTSQSEIVIAVFLNGTTSRPEVLRYSARVRNPASAELTIEDEYADLKEIKDEFGDNIPPGMRPSKTCKGLNLSDGRIDSAHIYWNHESRRFDDWTR
jgi:hypothetical protein